jgi:hypothetical protein
VLERTSETRLLRDVSGLCGKSGGIPAFFRCRAARLTVWWRARSQPSTVRSAAKSNFTPSARPAEVPSSFPPAAGVELATQRPSAGGFSGIRMRISRRRLCRKPGTRPMQCEPQGGSAKLSSLEGELSPNWRAGHPKRACERQSHQAITSHSGNRDHRPPVDTARSTSSPRFCREGPSGRPTLAHARRAAPALLGSRAP